MPSFSLLLATCFPFMTRPALPEDAARGIAPGTTTWSEKSISDDVARDLGPVPCRFGGLERMPM